MPARPGDVCAITMDFLFAMPVVPVPEKNWPNLGLPLTRLIRSDVASLSDDCRGHSEPLDFEVGATRLPGSYLHFHMGRRDSSVVEAARARLLVLSLQTTMAAPRTLRFPRQLD